MNKSRADVYGVMKGRHACAMYTFRPNDALYHVCSNFAPPVYLKPARKSGAMVGAVNTVNTVKSVNIVDLNAMKYKKQYNDSPQVLESRYGILCILFSTHVLHLINSDSISLVMLVNN